MDHLKNEQKQTVLKKFLDKKIQILVSTTIIEVWYRLSQCKHYRNRKFK